MGFFNILPAKYQKVMRDPLETLKIFGIKYRKIESFEQCDSVEKCNRGDLLVQSESVRKKTYSAVKTPR